jgi:DNA-directed RNA polymerase III subunit RPC1
MDAEKNEVAVRMVKAQLERTTLGEVVESIRIVLTPSGAHVAVRLDASTLRRLHLRIDAFTVKAALIAAPKLKLTAAIVQCVSVALAASSLLWLGWTERRSLLK